MNWLEPQIEITWNEFVCRKCGEQKTKYNTSSHRLNERTNRCSVNHGHLSLSIATLCEKFHKLYRIKRCSNLPNKFWNLWNNYSNVKQPHPKKAVSFYHNFFFHGSALSQAQACGADGEVPWVLCKKLLCVKGHNAKRTLDGYLRC